MGKEYTEAQKRATEKYMEGRKTIRVVVTDAEHAQIKAAAQNEGLKMSAYIKVLIEKNTPKKPGIEPFYGGRCAACGCLIPNKKTSYCSVCGQKIDKGE